MRSVFAVFWQEFQLLCSCSSIVCFALWLCVTGPPPVS